MICPHTKHTSGTPAEEVGGECVLPTAISVCLKRPLLSHGWPIVYVKSKNPFVWLLTNTEEDS